MGPRGGRARSCLGGAYPRYPLPPEALSRPCVQCCSSGAASQAHPALLLPALMRTGGARRPIAAVPTGL
eukprot:3301705-Prymnesium_polylepis.1